MLHKLNIQIKSNIVMTFNVKLLLNLNEQSQDLYT